MDAGVMFLVVGAIVYRITDSCVMRNGTYGKVSWLTAGQTRHDK